MRVPGARDSDPGRALKTSTPASTLKLHHDWQITMTSSTPRPTFTGYDVGKIAVVFAFATAVGALPMRSAFADQNDRHDDRQAQHQDRQAQHEPHFEGDRYNRSERGSEHERSHQHRYPVYAPPPAYYPRHPSPGIALFFPFEIR